MTSYIETAKDSISLGETVNIAQGTKQSGLGPVGIKGGPVGIKDINKRGPVGIS